MCERVAAFGATVALAMLLIAAVPSPEGEGSTSPAVGWFRLFESLMHVHLVFAEYLADTHDRSFPSSGDAPVIIDGDPKRAAEAAPATADGTDPDSPS